MPKYETGLERRLEYRERLAGISQMLHGLPAEQQNPIQIALIDFMREYNEGILDAAQNHKPLVCTWYGNAQEIFAGMGIKYYNPVMDLMFHLQFTDYADAKECDQFPLDDKICSLVRYAVWSMENRLHPKPDAFICMMEPCDGQVMLHQAFKRSDYLKDVPCFAFDPSYGHEDKDFEYVARQLRQEMVPFLERTTGAKYDFKRVAELVEETNKQYRIWAEVNEQLRASPCPMPSFAVPDAFWALTQHLPAGHPTATAIMQGALDFAKHNVANHVGPVMNEQIRILWPDLNPLWGDKLGAWLASEWNAVVVQTFQGGTPYTDVDTSNEEAMFFGLARRAVAEVPMIRQGRGWVDVFEEDVTKMINEFNINAVVFPGHMGHKDQSGSGEFLKRICRDMDVSLINMTTSLFDERYTPLDKVKNDLSNFFSASGFKRAKH